MACTVQPRGSLRYRANDSQPKSGDDPKFLPVWQIIQASDLKDGVDRVESEPTYKGEDEERSVVFTARTHDVGTFVWHVTYYLGDSGGSYGSHKLTTPDNVTFETDITFEVINHDDVDSDIESD